MNTNAPTYTHVIYHDPCFDGFTAAWVAWCRFGGGATYIGAQYGDPLPDVPDGARVLMVDVSWDRDTLEALAGRVHLHVLDHHRTAEDALAGLPYAEFDMDRSGAGMAWDHLFPGRDRPAIVAHVEDRDLWRFALPGTRHVHAYMGTLEWTFEAWEEAANLLQGRPRAAMIRGDAVLAYEAALRRAIVADVHTVMVRGPAFRPIPVAALNLGVKQLVSEVLHDVLDMGPATGLAVAYARTGKGDWTYSVRSAEGADVTAADLARANGGGGHVLAAGWRSDEPPVVAWEGLP